MFNFKIIVLISGNGSNLQYLIDNLHNNIIKVNNTNIKPEIIAVISNKRDAYGLVRAFNANIKTFHCPFLKKSKNESRKDYENKLSDILNSIDYNLIVCAGWMHILGENFLEKHKNIINLHPALPNTFPGKNGIKDAYNAFLNKKITKTGCMVHWVIPEIDAGEVISIKEINLINEINLTEEILKNKIQKIEKKCLYDAIIKIIENYL